GDWATVRPRALAEVRRRIDQVGELAPEEVARALGRPRRGYGAYQRLGDLYLDLAHRPDRVDDYRRELDLVEAVARVRYRVDGVTHRREFFASYPARAIVGRLWADTPAAVTLTVRLAPGPATARLTVEDGLIVARGALVDNGLRYEVRVLVRAEGGRLTAAGDGRVSVTDADDGRVSVTDADAVTLFVVAGTDYAAVWPHYRGPDPPA